MSVWSIREKRERETDNDNTHTHIHTPTYSEDYPEQNVSCQQLLTMLICGHIRIPNWVT